MEEVRKKLYERLYGADRIILQEYDNYCPYKAADGGQYLEETEYIKTGDTYEVYHYTSAEFDFCPIYGQFRSCEGCFAYSDGCHAKPGTADIDDIVDLIAQSLKEDNIQVYAVFGNDKRLIVTCDRHRPGHCSVCNGDYEAGSYIVEEK